MRFLLASTALVGLSFTSASAQSSVTLPTGGHVIAGNAVISSPNGASLIVNQSSRNAIINWGSFSVGRGNSAHFQNGSGATLNRVTGFTPSQIDGSLTASGSLYLVNPNGIAIGSTGQVVTGGSFIASTHDVDNRAFMAGGDLTFKGDSKASVVNYGQIGSLGGDVALIARKVENAGSLTAPNGTAALAAGYEVLVRDASLSDGKFVVKVGGADTEAKTTGKIRAAEVELRANGGNVYALAGNTESLTKATGVAKKGGRIFLTAGDGEVKVEQKVVARAAPSGGKAKGGEIRISGGKATVSGRLDARGEGDRGGTIIVSATDIVLNSAASVDVSGTEGGLMLIGGDYQGGKDAANNFSAEAVPNAQTTTVEAGAALKADGTAGGGGNVVVWADDVTRFAGTITATGTGAGAGGFAEVSGKRLLDYTGTADLRSESGAFGTLLLDPYNLTISSAASSGMSGFTAGANDSVLKVNTLTSALATANVVVTTGGADSPGTQAGDILVRDNVIWNSAATLTLSAYRNIAVNSSAIIGTGGGSLVLRADNSGTGIGTVTLRGVISASGGGSVQIFYNPAGEYNGANASTTSVNPYSSMVMLGGGSTLTAYMLVNNVNQLQAINTSLSGIYALGRDIDASETASWNSGAGFVPLGTVGNSFTGIFDGQGHVIDGLTIYRPATDYVGLFGYTESQSVIRDIGLSGGTMTGSTRVGGLVGYSQGNITNAYATGNVTSMGNNVGGLVGEAGRGRITNAYATGNVISSGRYVGGLIGLTLYTSITNVYATGNVAGSGHYVGGLVGSVDWGNVIVNAYAAGNVTSAGDYVGGFAGFSSGSITNAYATGSVTGAGNNVGGFAGLRITGSITNAYWDVDTSGTSIGVGLGGGDVTGLSTAQAFTQSSYAGFDFGSDWYMVDGQTRPFLRSEWSTTITNAHQLQLVNMNLSASYTLVNDIDMSALTRASGMWRTATSADPSGGYGFVPLGTNGSNFTGTFDGQGHVIDGLTIYRPTTDYVGLFGSTGSQSVIRDIGLSGGAVTGSSYVGSLAGLSRGNITNAYATGNVIGMERFVGGFVGSAYGGTITNAYATGNVIGMGNYVGGFMGSIFESTATNAYSTGSVTGTLDVGGFVGNVDSGGTIENAYATGSVTGSNFVGGFAGFNGGTITNAYAIGNVTGGGLVGGFAGYGWGTITNAYWDTDTTGRSNATGNDAGSAGITGLTTAEFQNTTEFTALASAGGWDFETVWAPSSAGYYPELYALSPVVWVKADDVARDYGDENPAFTEAGRYGGTSAYVFGAGGDSLSFTSSLSAPGVTANVGTYDIAGAPTSVLSSKGVSYRVVYSGALAVTPASLTITADDVSKTYGATPVLGAFTASGLQNGETVGAVTLASAGTAGTAGVANGPYAITASDASGGTFNASNYTILYVDGTLMVTPVSLTITADDVSKIYGATPVLGAFTASGLQNGETVGAVTLTSAGTAGTASVMGSPYAISASNAAGGTFSASNYTILYADGALMVTPASLTITADDVSKIYGATPVLGAFTASGLQNGETVGAVTLASAGTAGTASVMGSPYAISASNAAGGTFSASNYTILYADGALMVTPASLTITADDVSKIYGEANPALTYSSDGLVNGDSLSGSLATSAGATTNVGSYAITQGSLAASTNYALSYVGADLRVTQRTLTVTAHNGSMVQGARVPALGYSVSGWANGEGNELLAGVAVTTDATSHSLFRGTYVTTVSGGMLLGAAAGNYALNYLAGRFFVLPQPSTAGLFVQTQGPDDWLAFQDLEQLLLLLESADTTRDTEGVTPVNTRNLDCPTGADVGCMFLPHPDNRPLGQWLRVSGQP